MAGGISIGGGKLRTPVGDAPVIPLFFIGAGFYLAWFGVHYWRSDVRWPSDPVKAVLQGKPTPTAGRTPTAAQLAVLTSAQQAQQAGPAGTASAAALAGAPASGLAGSALGQQIAADAQRYIGAGYVWGGDASAVGRWDCSSFVSYVLGHDLGLPLPGGRWGDAGMPPHTHGPTTNQYMLFGRGVPRSQVQPGDLIVSTVHMGIALSGSTMISAESSHTGTGTGGFPDGFPGGTPVYRRVTG